MYIKKIFLALLGGLCLWMVSLHAGAAYIGTVQYGGFEDADKVGVSPIGWTVYKPWQGGFETGTDYVKEGRFSLKTTVQPGYETDVPRASVDSAHTWGYFDTSAQYELSIWVLIPEGSYSAGAYLLPSLYNADGTNTFYKYASVDDYVRGDTGGAWVKTKVVFTPKRNFGAIHRVFIRTNEGSTGTIYWDDLQLHKLNADGTYADTAAETVYDPAADILQNGDFSALTSSGTAADKWSASGAWGTTAVVRSNEDGGNNAVLLSGSGSPYIDQTVSVKGGEAYTLFARYKTDGAEGIPVARFSFRNSADEGIGVVTTYGFPVTYGKWHEITYDVTVPAGATQLRVYLRKNGEPNVYYSRAALYRMRASELLTVDTDDNATFYYPDRGQGTATVTLNTDPSGKSVEFYLTDGVTEICRQTKPAGASLSFPFSIAEMEAKKAYAATAVLKNAQGDVLGRAEKTVYRFERPSALNKNGQFTGDGETITPVIGYHVYNTANAGGIAEAKAAGINVVQGMGAFELGEMGQFLDTCWYTYGIRVLVPLYGGNMLPAGHYVNAERTAAIITAYKDHPGVFGWMIQDEPFLHDRLNPEGVKAQLIESYRLIRTLDDVHPAYLTADYYSNSYYRDIGNCCDIIAPDDYALGAGRTLTSVYDNMASVNLAVRGEKPVYAILQTFAYQGGVQPTMAELRHMIYQSLLAGADAVGFYSFKESGWDFTKTTLYEALADFNEAELPQLYETVQRTDGYTETKTAARLIRQYADGRRMGVSLNGTTETIFDVQSAWHVPNLFTHQNTGFEAGNTTGWNETQVAPWTVANTGAYAYGGERSLQVTLDTEAEAAKTIAYTGAYTLESGKEYVMSAMVNPAALTSSDGRGGVQLYVKDGNDAMFFGEAVLKADGWVKTELTFTPTADTAQFYIRLREKTAGTLYIDDLVLNSRADLDAAAEATFGTVSAYPTLPMSKDNWTASSAQLTDETVCVHADGVALKAELSGAGSAQLPYKNKPSLTAGKEYEAAVWVYIPASSAGSVKEVSLLAEPMRISGVSNQYERSARISSTGGEWKRLYKCFTPTEGRTGVMANLRLEVETTGAAEVYFDGLTVVEKEAQSPVLQILMQAQDTGNATVWLDTDLPESGAFTVRYDTQRASAQNAGKVLIAAIYQSRGGARQLTEVHLGAFTAESTAVELPFTGVMLPNSTYTLKAMLWNSKNGMDGQKQAVFAFR